MAEQKRNAHGLFDMPVRFPEKERVTLTQADIERQLDAGAFLMPGVREGIDGLIAS